MASRIIVTGEAMSDAFYPYKHFWGIDRNVGWGCTNNYDDVLLIQYLINSLKITDQLVEDGIFGNNTYKAIARFQKKFSQYYLNTCVVDGKVNAVDGEVTNYDSGSKIYTIYLINYWFIEKKRIFYPDIRMDRDLPSNLCQLMSLTDY